VAARLPRVKRPRLRPGDPRAVWEQLRSLSIPQVRTLVDLERYPDTPSMFVIPARFYLALLGADEKRRREAQEYEQHLYAAFPAPAEGKNWTKLDKTGPPSEKSPRQTIDLDGLAGPEASGSDRAELLATVAAIWDRFEASYRREESGALSQRHEEFARWVAILNNRTQAAELAGYGRVETGSARRYGWELYHNYPGVRERVVELTRIKGSYMAGRKAYLARYVLDQWEAIANLDPRLLFDERGRLDPARLQSLPEGVRLRSITQREYVTRTSNGQELRRIDTRVTLPDPLRALEMLGRHAGVVKPERSEDEDLPEYLVELLAMTPEEKEARLQLLLEQARNVETDDETPP
jgi:hypothetical protein